MRPPGTLLFIGGTGRSGTHALAQLLGRHSRFADVPIEARFHCNKRGMPDLLAHGFQTLIHTAPGAGLFPFMVEDSLVGFLEQSSRFLKPVFADDTIYPALEVTELMPGRATGVVALKSTVFNQRKDLVLEGMQKFLIRRRPAG